MSSSFVPFAAISAMISFLTDGLIPSLHPLILHSLRLHLYAYLPMHFTTCTTLRLPFDLPTTIAPHSVWLTALGTSDIMIVISPSSARAIFPHGREVTLWQADEEEDLKEGGVLPSIARRVTEEKDTPAPQAIRVPTLRPVSPDSSSSSCSSSCDESEDGYSSEDSMTSVSSVYSVSPAAVETKPLPTPKPAVYRPRSIPKTTPTTYLYQGGKTNVVTGGVMLGGGNKMPSRDKPFTPKEKPYTPPTTTAWRAKRVLLGPESNDNWRRRN